MLAAPDASSHTLAYSSLLNTSRRDVFLWSMEKSGEDQFPISDKCKSHMGLDTTDVAGIISAAPKFLEGNKRKRESR